MEPAPLPSKSNHRSFLRPSLQPLLHIQQEIIRKNGDAEERKVRSNMKTKLSSLYQLKSFVLHGCVHGKLAQSNRAGPSQ
jgi:hypothetical protein